MTLTDRIIAYESGDLDDDSTLDLFAELVGSGLAWKLQGTYGRTAYALITSGYITPNGRRVEPDVLDVESCT